MVPVVSEVFLYLLLELWIDVSAAARGLVLDLLDEHKPSLQAILVVAEVVTLYRHDYLNESIHEDGEESDPKYLDYASYYFLSDAHWVEVSIANCRKCCQCIVHRPNQLIGGDHHISQMLFKRRSSQVERHNPCFVI